MGQFEDTVKLYAPMVRRIASVYERYPDQVDDLAQEVWMALWKALPRLNDPSRLKGYIARTTHNICVTHIRRASVRRTERLVDNLSHPALSPHDTLQQASELTRLIEAVRSLPENLKGVVSLYLEEIPVREIAAALGISDSNASVRLHRAKEMLRQDLGGAG